MSQLLIHRAKQFAKMQRDNGKPRQASFTDELRERIEVLEYALLGVIEAKSLDEAQGIVMEYRKP